LAVEGCHQRLPVPGHTTFLSSMMQWFSTTLVSNLSLKKWTEVSQMPACSCVPHAERILRYSTHLLLALCLHHVINRRPLSRKVPG